MPARAIARLLALPTPAHLALVIVVTLVKYGVDRYPSIDLMRALSANWADPHASPLLQPPDDYRLASPVSALAAGFLHLTSVRTFLAFHLVIAVLAVISPFALPRVRASRELRSLVTLLLIGSAIPAVLFGWVGGYDAVTVASLSVAILAEHRGVRALAWLFVALNNAPVAMLTFAVTMVHHVEVNKQRSFSFLLPSLGGLLGGVILIQLLLQHWGVATSRLSVYELYGFSRFFTSTMHFAPLIAIGGLGVGWVLLGCREVRTLQGGRVALIVACVATVLIPLIALDQTRVLSFVCFGLVLQVGIVAERALPKPTFHQVLHRMLPVSVLLVLPVVWDNQLVYAGWSSARAVMSFVLIGR